MKDQALGFVYIIANEHMKNVIKVGYSTKDPARRAKELSNTGAPGVYSVLYFAMTRDSYQVEQAVHSALQSYHVDKEWFSIDPCYAAKVIRSCCSKVELEFCSWDETRMPESEFMRDIKRRKENLANRNAQNLAIVKFKEDIAARVAKPRDEQKKNDELDQIPQLIQRTPKNNNAHYALRSRLEKEIAFLDELMKGKKRIDDVQFPYSINSRIKKDKETVLRRIKITEDIIQQLKSEMEE